MPLELGTYLSDLVSSNPVGSDNKSTADDHLRLIKSTLKASFPAVAGPVTKSHSELNAAHDQRVPVGGIIMWSGALAAIPLGWLLCNGLNGTPNLQDRFVIGAGSAYAVGATGGNKDAIVPSHSHTATLAGATNTAGNHTHTVNDPGHRHVANIPNEFSIGTTAASGFTSSDGANGAGRNPFTSLEATGISLFSAGDHAHTLSATGSTDLAGVSATNANLPPYFALAFIMKSA